MKKGGTAPEGKYRRARYGSETVVATYSMMKDPFGEWWIGVLANGIPHDRVGPFRTRDECNRAYTDLLELAASLGAVNQPSGGH